MSKVLCVLMMLLWAAAAHAQTDYFSRIVVGSTTPSATSPVKLAGLPARSSETQCAWIGGDGSLATGPCGTVTSVGLSMPSVFTVTGSPVTTSGTLTATLASPWTWTTGGVFGTTSGNFTLTSAGDLTLSAAGDIVLGPSGLDVLPDQGYTRHLGGASRKFASLHVAELWASAFVAQENLATVGGRVAVTPTTVLEADVSTGATTIQVKHNSLRNGEVVLLERNFQVEWMRVTSGPSGSGPYTYSVTRNLDGTGANAWSAGDAVVSTGVVGDGFMDLYSQRGARQTGFAGAVMASRPKYYISMDSPTAGGTTQVYDVVTGWTATFANGAVRESACGLGTGCPGNNAWRNGPSYNDAAIALSDTSINADRETGDVTVEAVLYWDGSTTGAKTVFSRHWAREWHLQVEQGNTLTFCQGDGTNYQCLFSSVPLSVGAWHHVVATRDAALRQVCFYVDGSVATCGTYAAVTIAQQNGQIGIGRSPVFGGSAWRGYISELALYTRKLTTAEIAAHYERIPVNEFGWTSGPTIVGNVRTGTAWNAVSPRWAIGNLNGLYDYTTTTYGAAFGDPTGPWTAIDASRWRLMNGTTELLKAQGGALTLSGPLSVAGNGGITLTADSSYYSHGAIQWQRAYTGGVLPGAGDKFAMYALSAGNNPQWLLIENIAEPDQPTVMNVTSEIYLTASGWSQFSGGQATGLAQIRLRSMPGPYNEVQVRVGNQTYAWTELSLALPDTLYFAADSDTLITRPSADRIDVKAGNVLSASFMSTDTVLWRRVSVPNGSASDPGLRFLNVPGATGFYAVPGATEVLAAVATGTSRWELRTGGRNNTEFYVPGRTGRTGTDYGSVIFVDRSTGTNNLPGMFLAVSAAGVYRFLWPDDAGLWRTAGAAPEADGTPPQNTGTVVGDQTSRRVDKIIERAWTTDDQDRALARILSARVYDFRYRDGRYNGERFSGIVTDEAPWLGKDNGKALNEVNAVGYLIGAIQALERRVSVLEAEKER